jgi:galactose-1-phosphate uridylyltransferase
LRGLVYEVLSRIGSFEKTGDAIMQKNSEYLIFDTKIGATKPENIINSTAYCPFCHRDKLENIIYEDGPVLMLKNKYPVLLDTVQTVIIESYECNTELSVYTKEHLYQVINFGISKWLKMMHSGEFASVLFYKNHGPYSGGTIRHPHMQIVGLKNVDYTHNIPAESLQGPMIDCKNGVELNLTDQPKIGFFEFNVRLNCLGNLEIMADYIQIVTHYLLNHFNKNCKSYNLFFYYLDEQISVKIVPRFVTSPVFVGYSIPQVSNRADDVIREIQQIYF